jgi:Ca-activated chloride channel family protein
MFILRISKYIILSALIAMARPRTFTVSQDRDDTKGIDIMLSVDVSLSMLAKDLTPDRLTALKILRLNLLIKDRMTELVWLPIPEAFTKVPVTSDHQVVVDELNNLNPLELQPGTAIGEGLSVAVNHLKNSKAKVKSSF